MATASSRRTRANWVRSAASSAWLICSSSRACAHRIAIVAGLAVVAASRRWWRPTTPGSTLAWPVGHRVCALLPGAAPTPKSDLTLRANHLRGHVASQLTAIEERAWLIDGLRCNARLETILTLRLTVSSIVFHCFGENASSSSPHVLVTAAPRCIPNGHSPRFIRPRCSNGGDR
jgi:hypothetical protein